MTLVEFPVSTLGDVPARLRQLADDIEAGQCGDVSIAAVALYSDDVGIFCFGRDGAPANVCMLMTRAAHIIAESEL